jgi:hypothetical protein
MAGRLAPDGTGGFYIPGGGHATSDGTGGYCARGDSGEAQLISAGAVALGLGLFVAAILFYTIRDSNAEARCNDPRTAAVCASTTLSALQITDTSTVTLGKPPAEDPGGWIDLTLTYHVRTTNNSGHKVHVVLCEPDYSNLLIFHPCKEYDVGAHKTEKFEYTRDVQIIPGHLADYGLINHTNDAGTLVTKVDQHPITGK